MKINEILEDKDTLELPDIEVGDEVKIGKWKNRKATVKGFKKDKQDNHPILKTTKGDTKLFKPRISKIEEYKLIKMNTPITYQSGETNYLIFKNPTGPQVEQLLNRSKELRGTVAVHGDIYMWKAFDQTHASAQREMEAMSIEESFTYNFVFSTVNNVDGYDWSALEQTGNYFYGDNKDSKHASGTHGNRSDIEMSKNRFLNNIFNYLDRRKK